MSTAQMKQKLGKPLYDRIIVRPDPEKKMVGDIHLPDGTQKRPTEGSVLAVGGGKYREDGTRIPMDIEVGDRVMFSQYAGAGSEFELNGEKLLIMREDEVMQKL